MVKTTVFVNYSYDYSQIEEKVVEKIGVPKHEIISLEILKKSLQINAGGIGYQLSVGVVSSPEREAGLLKMKKKVSEYSHPVLEIEKADIKTPPVVVGAGPAGLFAALVLAEAGAFPIVLERGDRVEDRARAVGTFFEVGALDTESNIQFGEGGAGAFSDGKLKVGSQDKYKRKALLEFVHAGADEDILYTVGAHLGTDKLPNIVKNIREKIISLGGTFIYRATLTDIRIRDGKLKSVTYKKSGGITELEADTLVLATGHSARDTFRMLYAKGFKMESRPFGIGMRIEHPREYINRLVYKDASLANKLGTASYHLVSHLNTGRSVYSFCMCPGGTVVPATSTEGAVVTNGMSEYNRLADNSNAAILVSVTPEDFAGSHVLAGIDFQLELERRSYLFGGEDYTAPAIKLGDFLSSNDKVSQAGSLKPSYARGVAPVRPEKYLPDFITDSIKAGLYAFDKWMPGFIYDEAWLTGTETRSTSPVRILRSAETLEAEGFSGIYPVGEGGGYAGGIISSAADGIRAADSIIQKSKK